MTWSYGSRASCIAVAGMGNGLAFLRRNRCPKRSCTRRIRAPAGRNEAGCRRSLEWRQMNSQTAEGRSPLSFLVGQLAWNVKRGVGTLLTMEFGEAHLSVREPIV